MFIIFHNLPYGINILFTLFYNEAHSKTQLHDVYFILHEQNHINGFFSSDGNNLKVQTSPYWQSWTKLRRKDFQTKGFWRTNRERSWLPTCMQRLIVFS